jgi:hypothetical protein
VELHAGRVTSTQVELFWNRPATAADSIRVWYGFSPVPLQYDIPAATYSSVTFRGRDTAIWVTGLNHMTVYHFGLQVKQQGLWSYVTELSRLSVETDSISDTVPIENRLRLQVLEFDRLTNRILLEWAVDTTGLSLETGIVWALDSGSFASPNPPLEGRVVPTAGRQMVYSIDMASTDLQFDRDYYFALWLRKVDGIWAGPTAATVMKLHIPAATWESVVYFDTANVIYALNRQVVLRKIDEMYVEANLRAIEPADLPWESRGFIRVSTIAFDFDQRFAPRLPLLVGLAYDSIPAPFTVGDVRMYHYDLGRGVWLLDTCPTIVDTVEKTVSVKINASDCTFPFVLLIDTLRPRVDILTDTSGSVMAGRHIFMKARTVDNIANAKVQLLCGRGDDLYGYVIGEYADRADDTSTWVVPGDLVLDDYGVRILHVITDGRFSDTINLSRDVKRLRSDSIPTNWLQWEPLASVTVLDDPSIGAVLKDYADGAGSLRYDKTILRLYRWGDNRWAEYTGAQSNQFQLGPTKVIWIKRRMTTHIYYGAGRTATLKNGYPVALPARSWVDFCLPYRFDVRVGDVLLASNLSRTDDAVLFCEWARNSADSLNRYFASGVYLPLTQGKDDPGYELTSRDGKVYTAFNNTDREIVLMLPPVPPVMSRVLAKTDGPVGWTFAVRARSGEGDLSPVYCGYREGMRQTVAYPLPPSWSSVRVGVYDRAGKSLCGNLITPRLSSGGCAYELIFENESGQPRKIAYGIERLAGPDNGVVAAILNPETGMIEESADTYSATVDANGRQYRILVAGTGDFIKHYCSSMYWGGFSIGRVFPNPCRGSLRIEYTVPYGGMEWVRCEIINPLGRTVWKLQQGPRLHPGKNEFIWNPEEKRPLAAGAYIVRLIGFDGRNRKLGERLTRITYLP